MILKYLKNVWEFINKINPESRSLIIVLLFGYVLYTQINQSTQIHLKEQYEKTIKEEKEAEEYAKDKAIEINRHVRLIAHKDKDAFDVLLLSYHNTKQTLQGFKFLYLSCLTESPKSIESPLLKNQWTNMDYIYYVDELEKLHNQEIVHIASLNEMEDDLPKLYRLVKSSDAKAVSFYVIEGKKSPIGILVMLYKDPIVCKMEKAKIVMPSIQKLAILLDYENNKE